MSPIRFVVIVVFAFVAFLRFVEVVENSPAAWAQKLRANQIYQMVVIGPIRKLGIGVGQLAKDLTVSVKGAGVAVSVLIADAVFPWANKKTTLKWDVATQAYQQIRFEVDKDAGLVVYVGDRRYEAPNEVSYDDAPWRQPLEHGLSMLSLVQHQELARQLAAYVKREDAKNVPSTLLEKIDDYTEYAMVKSPAELAARTVNV